jgi:hypothetical protein
MLTIPWMKWFRDTHEILHRLVFMEQTQRGHFGRASLTYVSDNEVYINPGQYMVAGVDTFALWWNEVIEFTCGEGNAKAEELVGAPIFHYLYIDYSSLTQNTLRVQNFYNSSTVPVFQPSKGGWYSGDDRCIGILRIAVGTGEDRISRFYQIENKIIYLDQVTYSTVTMHNTTEWQVIDVSTGVSYISPLGEFAFLLMPDWGGASSGKVGLWARPAGSAGSGIYIAAVIGGGSNAMGLHVCPINIYAGYPAIEVRSSVPYLYLGCVPYTRGFYLPAGM